MSDYIGIVGTGNMGAAIGMRLLDAGFPLIAFDKNPAALDSLCKRGVTPATSPCDVADSAEIVIACLPTPESSREVAFGDDGVSAGKRIKIHIETSTIGAPTMQAIDERLREKSIGVLDAPTSGGPAGVRAGTLSIMTAGSCMTFDGAKHVLSAIAGRVFYVGERPGLAQTCKLVNNAISITGLSVACEAIVMGVKAGLDAVTLIDIINASTGRNSATLDKFPKAILPRTFQCGSPLETGAKDIELYLAEAERLGVPASIAASVSALWQYAISQGGAKRDATTLIQYIEQKAGIEVRGSR